MTPITIYKCSNCGKTYGNYNMAHICCLSECGALDEFNKMVDSTPKRICSHEDYIRVVVNLNKLKEICYQIELQYGVDVREDDDIIEIFRSECHRYLRSTVEDMLKKLDSDIKPITVDGATYLPFSAYDIMEYCLCGNEYDLVRRVDKIEEEL